LKVDFSRDEILVFPTEKRLVRSSYSDCQARQAMLVVYSLEEILAENCARC
jgi:predicted nucleotidyltransferase component of viral defense system